MKAPPLNEALETLLDAWNHGVHAHACGMLNPSVNSDDWKACTCWFGRARQLLLEAGLVKRSEAA